MEKKERRIQDSILFLGNRDDAYRLYQAMDVFVLPSRYEGLPVVGVEAQAAGLPCVLSDKMTGETKMTGSAVFMNIGSDLTKWADKICKFFEIKRKNTSDDIAEFRFDINIEAKGMENFYLEVRKGC